MPDRQKSGFVLNLAPTGMVPTKASCEHVPLSPEEIIAEVVRCSALGITTVHLHARDEQGRPSSERSIYERIIGGIREQVEDLVICVSCSGRTDPEFKARSAVLEIDGDLKPDMASLTTSSLNFPRSASINTPDTVRQLAERMLERGIKPEIEVFDLGMINYANYLIKKGILQPPYYFNVILGNIASAQANLNHIAAILNDLPDESVWSLGGIGHNQLPAHALALSQGGGVRVGLEDNIWYDRERTHLATNQSLIERVIQMGKLFERQPMKPGDFRQLMKLGQ